MLADKEDLCLAGWPGWWGPDYRGRKDAIKQTVDAVMLDSDQSDDSLTLLGSWQLTLVLMSAAGWWLLTSVSQWLMCS